MESIRILAVSAREHGTAELARFSVSREGRVRLLPELARSLAVPELVYLSTCNRIEVLYRAAEAGGAEIRDRDDPARRLFAALCGREPAPGEAEQSFRRLAGLEAVEHLFAVASGLDSAQLGEREIQGQIRDALTDARAAGTAQGVLGYVLEEALRVARRVHVRTQLGHARVSLAEIAGDLLLERVRRTPSPVALVGVTPMTRRCAEILTREGVAVIVVNRTLSRAEALVAALGVGDSMSLGDFRTRPPRVEALLCATGSPAAILDRAALERLAAGTTSQEPPLIVDLAVPPDVDPAVAAAVEIPRFGMDAVNGVARQGHQARQAEATAARAVVEEALRGLEARLSERALAPVIRRINQRFRQTALEGIERLLDRRGLSRDDLAREDLERWAETLARRFAHLPTLGLKGLAAERGLSAVRSFLVACDDTVLAQLGDEIQQLEEEAPL